MAPPSLPLGPTSPNLAEVCNKAFDYDYKEIAEVVGRSAATCRQLVARARRKMSGVEPVEQPARAKHHPLVTAFWEATRKGDMENLLRLFPEEIEVHTDGGGKIPAAINVIKGADRAARFFAGLTRKRGRSREPCLLLRWINGSPCFLSVEKDGILQTTALSIRDGQINAVWIVRNPEKLQHLREPTL
jgi:RNA polymerase sigma-70 factor (ECF subfamily)